MKRLLLLFALFVLPTLAQQQVPIVSGVATVDVAHNQVFKVLLTQNVTSLTLTTSSPSIPGGLQVSIIFSQNSTGGYTVAFSNLNGTCTVATAASVTTVCQAMYDSSDNAWNVVGSTGSSSAATGQVVISTACNGQSNCFTAHGDGKVAVAATFTSGQNTITTGTNDPPFSSSDVGKVEFATYGCPNTNPAQCTSANAQGTITAVTGSHTATLSSNFTHSSVGGGDSNNFIWGTLDDTAIASAFAVVTSPAYAQGTIYLPCNTAMLISQPPFIRTTANPNGILFAVNGCNGTNTLIPVPNFNYAACATACIYQDSTFPGTNSPTGETSVIQLQGLSVFGGGIDCASCSFSGTLYAIDLGGQYADYITLTGWNWNNTSFNGVVGQSSYVTHSVVYMTGYIGCGANGRSTFYTNDSCDTIQPAEVFNNGVGFYDNDIIYDATHAGAAALVSGSTSVGTFTNSNINSAGALGGSAYFDHDLFPGGSGENLNTNGGYVQVSNSIINTNIYIGYASTNGTMVNAGGNTKPSSYNYVSGTAYASVPYEAGTVMCMSNAATITYAKSYLETPLVFVTDQTSGNTASATPGSTTAAVHCSGASDVVSYSVTPNPF